MNHRRRFLHQGLAQAASLGMLLLGSPARSQTYPMRSVRLVVPFAPGGPADTLGRSLAQKLGEGLGQAVVIDNRPGAGGTIGSAAVAQAAPDGYVVVLGTSSTHSISPVLNPRTPYRVESDFTPIVEVANAPGVVLVPNTSPARTLREFIELARRQPGQLSYGSSGIGTIVHLATEYFKAETETFIVHIPYRGTALAMSDLIAGRIDLLFDSVVTGLPQARDGRVRALAVTSIKASPLAPGIPPVSDVLPGFEAATWFGLFGPKGMPDDVTARINRAVNAALADPELRARFAQLGAEPTGGDSESLAAFVRADAAKWKRIVASRRIQLD
jgi:tripartite-type tricarboxylate transporter receptor subunit TctC